jgi:hypothetical protein
LRTKEARIRTALAAYTRSPWGRATRQQTHAKGLCKRASLVALELLHREGVDAARLWHLGAPKDGSPFAPSDEHYVVVVGDEAIDVTHRQFDPSCEAITRRPLREVSQPWHAAQPVCIGQTDPMIGTDLHAIPANWRELAEAVPPGDAIGWPYPGPWPAENPQPKE